MHWLEVAKDNAVWIIAIPLRRRDASSPMHATSHPVRRGHHASAAVTLLIPEQGVSGDILRAVRTEGHVVE